MKGKMAGTKKWWVVCTVALAIAVVAAGCKDDDPLAFSTKVTENNLCSEVAEVMCNNIFECCTGAEIEATFGVEITTSEANCRRDMRLYCEKQTSTLQYALDKGSASLIAGAVNTCLEAYVVGEEGCFPHVTEFIPECDEPLIKGNQKAGAECLYSFECVADTYCGPNLKCQALPKAGESCATAVGCASGLYCGLDEENLEYTCHSLKSAGTACDSAIECEAGTLCAADPEGNNICTALKAAGETCDSNDICRSNMCLPGTCENGATCYSVQDCGTGTCETSGASCYSNESCGGVCSTSGYGCDDINLCPGTCAVSGYSCTSNYSCNYGNCAITGGICYEGYEGSYCDTTDPDDVCIQEDACVSTETCETDVCVGMPTCEGRTCAEDYFTADYCDASLIYSFGVGVANPGIDAL